MTLTHHDRQNVLRMVLWYTLFALAVYLSLDAYIERVYAEYAGTPVPVTDLWRRVVPAAALFVLSVFLLLMPGTSRRMRLFAGVYAILGTSLLWWLVVPL